MAHQSSGVVLITGASMGLGEAIARLLAAEGRRVCIMARSASRLNELAEQIDGQVIPMACDITDAAALEQAVATLESEHGPIDALINNAAVFDMRPFWEQAPEKIGQIIDTNLKGLIYTTRVVVPHMRARQAGRIINIASVAGTRGVPQQATYCASKHGVLGFADALAQELQPEGISVSTLCPGGINTPLWTDKGVDYPGDLSRTMPPEEVAELVAFILSRPAGTSYKKLIFFPDNEWH